MVDSCMQLDIKDKKSVKKATKEYQEIIEFVSSQNRIEKECLYNLPLFSSYIDLNRDLAEDFEALQKYDTVMLALCEELRTEFWDNHLKQLQDTMKDYQSTIRGHLNRDDQVYGILKGNDKAIISILKNMDKKLSMREKMLRHKYGYPENQKPVASALSSFALPLTRKRKTSVF
jgi:hypothetical protein